MAQEFTENEYSIHGLVTIRVRSRSRDYASFINDYFSSFTAGKSPKEIELIIGSPPKFPTNVVEWGSGISSDPAGEIWFVSMKPSCVIVGNHNSSDIIKIYFPLPKEDSRTKRFVRRFTTPQVMNQGEGANRFLTYAVKPIVSRLLLTQDVVLIHAAGICKGQRGILIMGAPGAGKTSLTLELTDRKFDFLGDDLILLSKAGDMLSYPKGVLLRGKNMMEVLNRNGGTKNRIGLLNRFLFSGYMKKNAWKSCFYVKATDLIDNSRIAQTAKLRLIIHLQRYQGSILKMERIDLRESTSLGIGRTFFNDFSRNGFVRAMDFAKSNPMDDPESGDKFGEVISPAFKNADSYRLLVPWNATWAKLALEISDQIESHLDQ